MKQKIVIIGLLWLVTFVAIFGLRGNETAANDGLFSSNKRFGNYTFAGPFDLSNMKRKQAKSVLKEKTEALHKQLDLSIVYQDTMIALPKEMVTFDIDATLAEAISGQDNDLVAVVSREGLRTVLEQQLAILPFQESSVEALAMKIEQQLTTGILPQRVDLTEEVLKPIMTVEAIASASYQASAISSSFQRLLKAVDGTMIQGKSTFSFLDFIEEQGQHLATEEEMTIVASMLYAAALQTNWIIEERSISYSLTGEVKPGLEAAIQPVRNMDFVFTNPNPTSFTLTTTAQNGEIQLQVSGYPFLQRYEPYIDQLETYEPRTVIQYSSFVANGRKELMEQGGNGIEATVKRRILEDGQIIEDQLISSDFYAPQPKIERHPLRAATTTKPVTEEGSQIPTQTTPSINGETSSPIQPSPDSTNGSSPSNEEQKDPEVQYDKGGNPISPN